MTRSCLWSRKIRLPPVSTHLLPVERLPWTHSLDGRLAKAIQQSASGVGVGTRGQVSLDLTHMLSLMNILALSHSHQELNSQHKQARNGNIYFQKFSIVELLSTLHSFRKNPGLFSSASWGKIDAYCTQQLGWERELAVMGWQQPSPCTGTVVCI